MSALLGWIRDLKNRALSLAPAASEPPPTAAVALEHPLPGQLPGAPIIPKHALLGSIGKGAYGEVWLARDAVGNYRAVKVVRRSSFQDSAPFDREFRGIQQYTPISRTHHGLVPILHVGSDKTQGFFYYIMELGDCEQHGRKVVPESYCAKNLGRELDRRGRLPVQECLHLALELAEALHYLHSRHLIHRDIKPSNIIFVGGQPKFADVGLVTHMAEKGRDERNLGTEGFIAPEGPGTASADVYSLGKLIYEAAMGRAATDYAETSLQRSEEGQEELKQLNRIILKACQPELSSRYASAAEFQADLMQLNDRLYGGGLRSGA